MELWEAIIQGILQGASQFLPISSSGHLSLIQHVLGITLGGLFFDVLLHLGTLLAVLAVYYRLVLRLFHAFFRILKALAAGKFHYSSADGDERLLLMLGVGLLPLPALLFPLPGGYALKDLASSLATDDDILVEGISFLATAILLALGISGEEEGRCVRKQFRFSDALAVGAAQALAALFPGLSRSGSTLAAGMMRGVDRSSALDYSFVLGIPSILAAGLVSLRDSSGEAELLSPAVMAAGLMTSAAVGFLSLRLLRWMAGRGKLGAFAWYVFLLGTAVTVVGLMERSAGINLFTRQLLNLS